MADLVERLRSWKQVRTTPYPIGYYLDAGIKAADEIERLRAELSKHQESEFHPDWSMLEATRSSLREHQQMVRALRAEVADLRKANERFGKRQDWWNEQMFVLETERDRLRELLRELRKVVHSSYAQKIDAALDGEKKDEA